jgi:hypothetical protein
MNEAKDMIDWFWVEFHSDYQGEELCQCGTEKVIEESSDSDLMRSFLLIGVLIDQMMYTHYPRNYNQFRGEFKYPKLRAHGVYGMTSPNWVACSFHGYDKKMNWGAVLSVAQALFEGLFIWFRNIDYGDDEIAKFKKILKEEIHMEFESENRKHLLSVIYQI